MKILTQDMVVITAGKDNGKTGLVKRVLPKKNRVIIEGANLITKHVKASKGVAGQKLEVEASIHVSNVMVLCPKTNKPTRVGYTFTDSGEKVRIAKISGEIIPNKGMKK